MTASGVRKKIWTHRSVLALLADEGTTDDPERAIRNRARRLVEEMEALGWEGPPYDMKLLASFRGFRPEHVDWLGDDQDACITADRMLVNARKPHRRQRYSIGHEVGHTLFPDFEEQVQSGGPRWRQRDGQSQVEHLCQIAASELLMPFPAFSRAMREGDGSIASVLSLSKLFDASPEATARRFVELSEGEVVAVFLSMTHKPSELAKIQQTSFDGFGIEPPTEKLRLAYSAASPGADHIFLPRDKSIPDSSIAYRAWSQVPGGLAQADEDWSEVAGIGLCSVDAVALSSECVLCLLRLDRPFAA